MRLRLSNFKPSNFKNVQSLIVEKRQKYAYPNTVIIVLFTLHDP